MSKFLFLLLIFFCFHSSSAQENFIFKEFHISEGLPSEQVYQVVQDIEGYLWFATDRGVSQYDGYQFKTFTRKEGLTDEVVFGFYPQSNGRLWFYTYTGGICFYEKGKIIEPRFNREFKEILKQMNYPILVSLFVDAKGVVWVGTENSTIFKIENTGKVNVFFQGETKFSTAVIQSRAPSFQNFVLCGGQNYNLTKSLVFISHPDSIPIKIELPDYQGKNSDNRSKIYRINENTFIYAFGSILIKIKNGKVIQHKKLVDGQQILYALLLDKKGDFWIGTTNGVYCFKGADLASDPNYFLGGFAISSIWQDHEEGYWFTSLSNGVFYIPNFSVESLSSQELKDKPLFIVSNSSGVFVGSRDGNLIYFKQGNFDSISVAENISPKTFPAALWKGRVLVEITGKGASQFQDFVHPNLAGLKKRGFLRRNDERSLYLWSHRENEFHIFSETTGEIVKSCEWKNGTIRALAQTKDLSKIWIGTSFGLWLYENDSLTSLGDSIHFLNGRISDLDLISDDVLVITTRGNGVIKHDLRDGSFQKLKNLPNEYCNQTFVDDEDQVWITSFSGLTCIKSICSPQPIYLHYSTVYGLVSNEAYQACTYKEDIWLATGKGISKWKLNWEPPLKKTAISLHRLTVNGESRPSRELKNLSYNQNNLKFFFSAIRFQEPMQYQYRLKGLHANWISTNNQYAAYTSLGPGKYTLELKAINEEILHASIPIEISYPLWQNFWFWFALILVVAIALIFALQLRYRVILKENKLYALFVQSEQKALRAQLNPHFLFNAFNSIVELLAQKKYGSAQKYMTHFSTLMRLVLQSSREKEIFLIEELKLLKLYVELEKLRFESSLDFQLHLGNSLDAEMILVPPLIIQPYIENAIKHGIRSRDDKNGLLSLSFEREGNILVATITDNGKGYEYSLKKKAKRRKSYGMKINRERIDLFGEKNTNQVQVSTLNADDLDYPGTKVKIYLPYKSISQHEKFSYQSLSSRR